MAVKYCETLHKRAWRPGQLFPVVDVRRKVDALPKTWCLAVVVTRWGQQCWAYHFLQQRIECMMKAMNTIKYFDFTHIFDGEMKKGFVLVGIESAQQRCQSSRSDFLWTRRSRDSKSKSCYWNEIELNDFFHHTYLCIMEDVISKGCFRHVLDLGVLARFLRTGSGSYSQGVLTTTGIVFL